jgi:hypothetical protein
MPVCSSIESRQTKIISSGALMGVNAAGIFKGRTSNVFV